jgi:hypothetical protein
LTRFLGIASALVLCLAPPALAESPVARIGSFTFAVSVDSNALQIPYDGNQSLTESHPGVVRAVVIIPGSNRNSGFGYETLLESATIAGMNDTSSLLVVPQYLIEEDIAFHGLPADRLYWSESGWKEGNRSLSTASHPRPWTISSFAILDSILYLAASRNPNLQSIVVAGHSAGGQFVNRYAAGSAVQQALEVLFGVQVSYVAANPSSYLYLNAERIVPGTPNSFAVPGTGACSGYDRYKYGLQSRNSYMSAVSSAQIISQYAARQLTYLLGQLDTDPAHPDLDTSCPAMLQGDHRLERGLIYRGFLLHFYGASIAAMHSTIVVPGVGHDSREMFTSACGVVRLFGAGSCEPVGVEDQPEAPGDAIPRGWLRCEPNPFRSGTRISFGGLRDSRGRATMGVYDARGRLLRTLEDGAQDRGRGSVVWDGRASSGEKLPPGVYFLRLQDGRAAITKRVVLLR